MKNIKILGKVFSILFIVFGLKGCTSETKKNDLQKESLNGKVMAFQTLMFEVEDEFGEIKTVKNINSKSDPIKLNNYDENGFLTEINYYKPAAYLDLTRIPEINSSGKYDQYERKINIIGKTIYKYDENNLRIEKRNYDKSGSLEIKIIYNYDENGNEVEKKLINKNGSLIGKTLFEYNKKNNKIKEIKFDENGKLKTIVNSKYDENENQSVVVTYDSTNRILSKTVYNTIENKKGKEQEYNFYNSNDVFMKKIIFKEDVNGFSLGISEFYSDGTLYYKSENINDSKGNVIESKLSIPEKKLSSKTTYEYEFDEKDNWTKKIEYKNGIAETMTIRVFKYY